ncbi:MAG: tetratricopeptide repeat protein, partial [Saprospiraceae bacterium]|nr:tetratricopeptide repeat protein [Saprospiraceae bacterium]
MKNSPLLVFLLLLLVKANAQTSITGFVKDRKAKPVGGVLVGVFGVTPQGTTNLGQFELKLPKRDEFVAGSKIVFSVQKDGWSVLDERDLFSFVPLRPGENPHTIRMVNDTERDADLKEQEKNIRAAIEQEFKKQVTPLYAQIEGNKIPADSLGRLNTRIAVLTAERDQALSQVADMVKTLYKVDLAAASQLYRDAYELSTKGKTREANELIEKANLDEQLQKIEEEERQHTIRLEELAKGRRQIAETYVLQAKNSITSLDFAAAEQAYDKAVMADPKNDEVIFAFAFFLQQQNNFIKAALFYEKSLLLSKDEYGRAVVLNNIGNIYRANQKMPEAERAYVEALGTYRKLSEKNPDAFLPDVATTLNNLGVFYSDNQRMPEAERAYVEALGIRRKLSEKNPDAFLPDVASTLNNLGNYYRANQKMPEAERAYVEALGTYRKLSEKNPDAFLP